MEKYGYKFSFGPWNIHEGADPFGPDVRSSKSFDTKLKFFRELGYDQVQFHDDDAVPDLDDLSPAQILKASQSLRDKLMDHGFQPNLLPIAYCHCKCFGYRFDGALVGKRRHLHA